MNSKKRVLRFISKFLIVSTTFSCFSFTSAMESNDKKNQIIKNACYQLIKSDSFKKQVYDYISKNIKNSRSTKFRCLELIETHELDPHHLDDIDKRILEQEDALEYLSGLNLNDFSVFLEKNVLQ